MDSKEEHDADAQRHKTAAAENSNTSALQKKRARRVSFAELTSVHFFDRDEEDNEAPSTETEKINDDTDGQLGFAELIGDGKEFEGEEDGGESDDEEMEMPRSFLRPAASPSTGGSTFGSASSNDEDNFFGPVSAHFIRPGRFSDSGASDDNRDVTMDSTTFSMHFRSLVRSDSGVDLKTPTRSQLFSEEKTPTNTDAGSSMAITLGKKPNAKSSILPTEASGSHNSNDMSLVGENHSKYDYEKLSPGLDALLAETRKNLLSVSVSGDIITSVPTIRNETEILPLMHHSDKLVNLSAPPRNETGSTNSYDVLHLDKPAHHIEFSKENSSYETFPNGQTLQQISSTTPEDAASKRDAYMPNKSSYQLNIDKSEAQLVSSTSPVKRQQIVLRTGSPKILAVASPMAEPSFPLLRSGSVEHQDIQTSIQKSISKLESLEKSAFSSAFAAKVDSSTIRSLNFLKSPNIYSLLEKNHHPSSINEDSFVEVEFAAAPLSKEKGHSFRKARERGEAPNHFSGEKYWEYNLGEIISKGSPKELSAKNLSVEQSKQRGVAASSTKITWSGSNLMRNLFASKESDEDALMNQTESLLAEFASGDGGKQLSTSPGLESRPSEDLLPHSQLMHISEFYNGRDSTPEKIPVDVSFLSATSNRNGVAWGVNGELISPVTKVNGQKDMFESKGVDNQEVGKEMIVKTGDLGTPKENNFHPTNRSVGNLTNKNASRFENNSPGGEFRVSRNSLTPSSSRYLDEPKLFKNQAASPSRRGLANSHSPRITLAKSTRLSDGLESFSSKKRSTELLLRDSHSDEMAIQQRSPKIQKGRSWALAPLYPNEGRTAAACHEQKWTDTYSKFSEDVEALIYGSADGLNSKSIEVLEDMLVCQQRSKKYGMLHLGVLPQGKVVLEDLQIEKMDEVNSLLYQVVFQRTKLQLKRVKRERLSKRLQLLNSRIQESEILRANIALEPLETCSSKAQDAAAAADDDDLSSAVNLKKGKVVCQEKLTAMRQELEALNKKILNLTRTLHSCCKMKTEPNCGKTVALINEHLAKKASYRLIRMDIQMWSVQSVGSSNGHHNVILNYLDFIIQSIKIILGPTSSVATSVKLIETNITKNFPNMDACVAFAFVFSAETTCKYVGTKTLARETQITSSILGTLLDVAEEVQLAQMELLNLTQSSFCTFSTERLDLMLSFFNFKSGRKVTLTLDMSCLKCGIYPSEIVPLQMTSTGDILKYPPSTPIFDEIRAAVKGIRFGCMRILRLCQCVCQVVQASTA